LYWLFFLNTINTLLVQPRKNYRLFSLGIKSEVTLLSIYINSVYQTIIVCHKTWTINNRTVRGGEIIGIAIGESVRTCESHEVFGELLDVGDLLKFKRVVIEVDGEEQDAIKIQDGTESCHVGFLTRHFVHGRRKEAVVNTFGQVSELYKNSNDMKKQRKNRRLFGVTPFRLLDDIQDVE
jgi:hypothetical protein